MTPFRLAVFPDFPEEGWPSMDLTADMLLAHLPDGVAGVRAIPPFRRLFSRLPFARRAGFNADRLVNRFRVYPRYARTVAADAYYVADHSYAHLVHALPAERTGVYCHDLLAFRCLLDPAAEPRPRWFRALARRTLAGMQKAARVFVNSAETRAAIRAHDLVPDDRLHVVPLGAAPEFQPGVPVAGPPTLLHVGSCVPRKRIDVLLDAVAGVRDRVPGLRFVKVGGPFTPDQERQLDALNLRPILVQKQNLSRLELADVYRAASAVLMPSDFEGFGLPVVEALACGVPVVASDLPVFREVGADAVSYAPVAAVPAWVACVVAVLSGAGPSRERRLARAAEFSWTRHAARIVERLRP